MRYLSSAILVLSLAGAPVFLGCDRTVSHQQETQTDSNGTVKKTDTTVKQDSNGNIIKDQTKSVDKPQTPPPNP